MAICRVNKTKNYTVMSNCHLRDKKLSLKAKGLLSVVLSLPDDWDYSVSGLCAVCGEGETTVKSAIKELKANGYLMVTKVYPGESKTGRIEYVYDFFENKDGCVQKNQADEKQGLENLGVESLGVETRSLPYNSILSTDELSTDELSTDNKSPHSPPEGEQQKPKRKRKSDSAEDVEAAVKAFGYPESTNERLREWLEVRNAKRTPNTVSAIQKCIKTLPDMARKSNLGIDAYLDQVIMRGWAAFYEIRAYQPNNGAYSRNPEPPAPQYREAK